MCPGGLGYGAPVQQPVCAQGLSCSQLSGQRPEAGEGVSTGPQQGRIQQVGGLGGLLAPSKERRGQRIDTVGRGNKGLMAA